VNRYLARVSCRRLVQVGVGAWLVFVIAYVIFVLTPIGQLIDDELLETFRAETLVRTTLTSALHLINVVTIAIAGIVIVSLAAIRHRFTIGVVAVVSFGVAIIAAEVFKLVLPRPAHQPELDEALGRVGVDTYPSGHSTIITAGVIALLWAWGAANRAAWVLGAAVVIVVVSATVIAGWHRPSDGIGGISLAIAVLSMAGWWMTCRVGPHSSAFSGTKSPPNGRNVPENGGGAGFEGDTRSPRPGSPRPGSPRPGSPRPG
jgi:membrane-associated phospholipid phosphatase